MVTKNVLDFASNVTVSSEQSNNLGLASVAIEEMALCHLINSEAEAIHKVLTTCPSAAMMDLVHSNEDSMLNDIIYRRINLLSRWATICDSYILRKDQVIKPFIKKSKPFVSPAKKPNHLGYFYYNRGDKTIRYSKGVVLNNFHTKSKKTLAKKITI